MLLPVAKDFILEVDCLVLRCMDGNSPKAKYSTAGNRISVTMKLSPL
jgi:hypothetical protein